ncbi:glycosyltransferase [Iocasia frigidifontis]|uniref:Glycosyltransferase n=2 Tax=Iocasia fonsfrigidae TaxID=2682810 RepID=A0A8A7KCA0_9FIRM|nr:glycosyltransferase [Iocasia fonsfrigidae]
MMKILFLARPDLFRIRAGDTVQLVQLTTALEKVGLNIDLRTELDNDMMRDYDLVHLFNVLRCDSSLKQCLTVKSFRKPLIITPIYWNMREYLEWAAPSKLAKWNNAQQKRGQILSMADLIAPNAEREWLEIEKDFAPGLPHRVIYNGVNPFFYNSSCKERSGIISVGRIHQRKNQLTLIRALNDLNIPVTIIGDVNDRAYYQQCMSEKKRQIKIITGLKQSELLAYYGEARVHLLASWYDTPGLVNLEAGLAGCNLVTTNRGTAQEYFADYAYYCSPDDCKEIREKTIQAYYTPLKEGLPEIILKRFGWGVIAEKTKKIYNDLLNGLI